MKFITYKVQERESIGILSIDETKVADINKTIGTNFKDMNDLISDITESELELLESKIYQEKNFLSVPLSEVQIMAPILYPKRPLICLGKNYKDHAKEVASLSSEEGDVPKFPIFFLKIASPATSHGQMIPNHLTITNSIDYEVELAVIIGKDGINISQQNAYDHVFGYTIANDISARNIQKKHSQWFKGKSLEGFAPMGPTIVHKKYIKHPVALNLSCSINGEVRQQSNTREMLFDIATIIEELSKGMMLRKGDIILTGTPAGVGLSFNPHKFLNPGDVITSEIENIGILENTIKPK